MTDNRFSVVFRGDIVFGKNLLEVKQNLKGIFKVDDARIDALFTGKPVPLKTNLDQAQAEKYQTILEQAGIIVSLEASDGHGIPTSTPKPKPATPSSPPSVEKNPPTESSDVPEVTEAASAPSWDLKPTGSLLQEAKPDVQAAPVNVDHIGVTPQAGNLLKDDERLPEVESPIDADALDWDLSAEGEALLKEAELQRTEAVNVDTSALTLSQAEGDLLEEHEKEVVVPVSVDISHLSLAGDESSKG